jgi:hypothetical protein
LGTWNIIIIRPTYPAPRTPIPRRTSAPSTHAGPRSCTGIAIRSSRSGGTSYREELANWKGHKHSSFQALDPRSVVGSFRTWDAWSLHMPSRLRSRLMVGFPFPFGWCSGGRGSLWRAWCVQKVPLEGQNETHGTGARAKG